MPVFPFFSSTQIAAPRPAPAAEAYNLEYPTASMIHAAARNAQDQPSTISIFSPLCWLQFDQRPSESVNTVQGYNSQFGMQDDNYQYPNQVLPMDTDQVHQLNDEDSVPNSVAHTRKDVHNAMERRRRNKMKFLYSELRSLLPNQDTQRRLSIPGLVGQVLRYIPELRKEIEELRRQRDDLLTTSRQISRSSAVTLKSCTGVADLHELVNDFTHCSRADLGSPNPINVSVNSSLGSSELIITIYARRAGFMFSTLLRVLEKEGLDVLSASAFHSQHQVCHNLHLKIIGMNEVDTDLLRKKLVTILRKQSRGM